MLSDNAELVRSRYDDKDEAHSRLHSNHINEHLVLETMDQAESRFK